MQDASTNYEENLPTPHPFQIEANLVKTEVLGYMMQLHGWCAPEKACFLIDLVLKTKPKKVVEIGVWGGKSFLPMAQALRQNNEGIAYGIDPWESSESVQWVNEPVNRHFWEYADHNLVYQHLNQKIAEHGLRNQTILIKSTSEDAPIISDIDILHIDGNHSEHASYIDVTKWVPLVRSGGWIIFDDMRWFENGVFTTAKASDWLDANCHKIAEFTDICTWGVWVKP
jgi:predicted O-methyltransferase YrrM